MNATEKQLNYIADLRNKKDLTSFTGNINELYSDYISKFDASCLINDLLALDDKKEEQPAVEEVKIKTVFKPGMKVSHQAYGVGEITKIKKDKMTVVFEGKTTQFPSDSEFLKVI